MPVYHRFGSRDLLWAVTHTSPLVDLISGSGGWRGNLGPSSSLSLYEGVRSNPNYVQGNISNSGLSLYPLDPLDTNSIDRTIFISGSYPATGSVQMVAVRNSPHTSPTQVDSNNWFDEHFSPVNILYGYYSKYAPDVYFTGSYDYYSLFFNSNSPLTASFVSFGTGSAVGGHQVVAFPQIFGHHTVEVWFKPLVSYSGLVGVTTKVLSGSTVTGAGTDRASIVSDVSGHWKVFITGTQGNIAFSDVNDNTVVLAATASFANWNHVAIVVPTGSALSASAYVNGQPVGFQSTRTSLSALFSGGLPSFDNIYVGADFDVYPNGNSGFVGSVFEFRLWRGLRAATQVSASYATTLVSSSSLGNLVVYARFNDGPLGQAHGFTKGSGSFNCSPVSGNVHGQFNNFGISLPVAPTWQPNDHAGFYALKTPVYPSADFFKILHVPSMFYGRQIATGSVRLDDGAYSGFGLRRVLVDDGRGGLYLSGSSARPARLAITNSDDDYAGSKWNKVGNVFYTEGLLVITDPSILDYGDSISPQHESVANMLGVRFSGQESVSTKVFVCRVPAGDANASNNPTFATHDTDPLAPDYGRRALKTNPPITWITAVGIYNEDRKLVAIAKLAQPIRKRERDKLNIRLRMDW